MMIRRTIHQLMKVGRQLTVGSTHAMTRVTRAGVSFLLVATMMLLMTDCERMPELHLRIRKPIVLTLSEFGLRFETYWSYQLLYDIEYHWEAEWYNCYGWDEEDEKLFGPIGYPEPTAFNLYRYHTGSTPYAPHTTVMEHYVPGHEFVDSFELGFWDLLVFNQLVHDPADTHLDKTTTLDSVFAYTSQDYQVPAVRSLPQFPYAFYQPEPIYSAYTRAIEINADHENDPSWSYDPVRDVYIKRLDMTLMPVTYIYLTQVILRHNKRRVVGIDGRATLSGMARSTNINTGHSGSDDISHYFFMRFKSDRHYQRPFTEEDTIYRDEQADMIGGMLMTFGLPDFTPSYYLDASVDKEQRRRDLEEKLKSDVRHYLDLKVQWNHGRDTTFTFDVTDQVRKRFRGGVITVEIDMDTVPTPNPNPHSTFDAVVKDYDTITHVIDM